MNRLALKILKLNFIFYVVLTTFFCPNLPYNFIVNYYTIRFIYFHHALLYSHTDYHVDPEFLSHGIDCFCYSQRF
ncbi:hypothetical protein Glove_194g57 [Diversispora epigaea]|uniref:Secreted protein n=1 Tax=Diversispora epigaea TaxID=1348612 RepID=A0A397IVT5_9GLOM|nr:hypothetical protein Glove_194g57 [Diversispora epigaea]